MTRALSRTLAAALLSLPACAAVLGLEEAELERGIGGAGGTSGGPPRLPPTNLPDATCNEPASDCASCLAGCEGAAAECLASGACRKAAYAHASCLTDTCRDPSELCRDTHLAISEADTLAACLGDTCVDHCAAGALFSVCQLYCACMENNCAPAPADCLAACAAQPPSDAYCKWQHCEAANAANPTHCEHALGRLGFCPRSSAGNACPDRVHSGFPCRQDTECCSNRCRTEVCD